MARMKAAILTVSDRCARGEAEDRSGPALRQALTAQQVEVIASAVVPDDEAAITSQLVEMSDHFGADVVFTTGGTGLGPRDVTPEATEAVIESAGDRRGHTRREPGEDADGHALPGNGRAARQNARGEPARESPRGRRMPGDSVARPGARGGHDPGPRTL
jgi:molybdenum cofactor synthesis domain-containing protein